MSIRSEFTHLQDISDKLSDNGDYREHTNFWDALSVADDMDSLLCQCRYVLEIASDSFHASNTIGMQIEALLENLDHHGYKSQKAKG